MLEATFPITSLQQIPRKPTSYLLDGQTSFVFFPSSKKDPLIPAKKQVLQRILDLKPHLWEPAAGPNRRYRDFLLDPKHMGFYEQNLPNNHQRTWKLYEATDKLLLQALKPLLCEYSEWFTEVTTFYLLKPNIYSEKP